jgi:hypothetical protein
MQVQTMAPVASRHPPALAKFGMFVVVLKIIDPEGIDAKAGRPAVRKFGGAIGIAASTA